MTELRHHGILGMKWGVRRYQNADGTLTAAGKRRYRGAIREAIKNEPRSVTVSASRRAPELIFGDDNSAILHKARQQYKKVVEQCKKEEEAVSRDALNDKMFVAKCANDIADAYWAAIDSDDGLPSKDPDYSIAVNFWFKRNLSESSAYGPRLQETNARLNNAINSYWRNAETVANRMVSTIKDKPINGLTISDVITKKIVDLEANHAGDWDVPLALGGVRQGHSFIPSIEPKGLLSSKSMDRLIKGVSYIDSNGVLRDSSEAPKRTIKLSDGRRVTYP